MRGGESGSGTGEVAARASQKSSWMSSSNVVSLAMVVVVASGGVLSCPSREGV